MSLQQTWRIPAVILFSAAVILGLNMGVRQTFGLFLEPMTLELGISRSNFSLAIAIQNLLWGVLTPVFGILSDRYGTARCLVSGGVLYVIGIVIMAMSQSALGVHVGAGVLVGIAVAACGFPMVLAAVARHFPAEKRSLALGLASSGGSAGQFLLLPTSQIMIQDLGWVTALLVLAGLSALIVPLAAALVGKPGGGTPSVTEDTLWQALRYASRQRDYLLLNAGFFVCGFHVAFIGTHLPGYVVTCNLDPLVGATSLGVIGFFNILGGIAAGFLGGKFRKNQVLAGIYLARAVVISLLLIAPKTEVTLYLFSAAFGLLWLSTVPLTSGLVADIYGPKYMASLFGIVMLSHQVGAFFGAWFGGISYDYNGSYEAVFYISVLLGLLAAALNWPIVDRPVSPGGRTEAATA